MNDNAFYFVLAITAFCIFYNALISYGERQRETAWRKRKTAARKKTLTQNKEVI